MREQELLFSIESALDIHPLENFKILFDNLNADHLDSTYITGRKPFPQQGFLKAIIFKNLTGIPTLNDLSIALKNNPSAAIRCGFNILNPLPSVERFSEFLRNKDNNALQKIRIQLVHELISMGLINGNYLSIDILAELRQIEFNIDGKGVSGFRNQINQKLITCISGKFISRLTNQYLSCFICALSSW